MVRLWAGLVVLIVTVCWLAIAPSYAEDGCTTGADTQITDIGDDLDTQGAGFADPYETVNRSTLKLNQGIDRWVLEPFTEVYRFLVPEIGRRGIRNMLLNLNMPAVLANDLLQLEVHDAALTTARFMVNTTMGLAGFIDVGELFGMPAHQSDFGQTMARAGVGAGPYIMLPVFGPSTARDGTGVLVDFLLRPTSYVLIGLDSVVALTTIQTGSAGLAEWEAQSDNLHRLDDSSIDFYAALRSAYYQNRMAEIQSRDQSSEPAATTNPPAPSSGTGATGG